MKKILILMFALFSILGFTTAASAVFFELDHFNVALRDTDPGLVVHWSPLLTTPVGANLGLGDCITVDLFKIWTDESAVNDDDTAAHPIKVDFHFSQPTPSFSGSASGETFGEKALFGFLQGGKVEWDGPSIFNFGALGDGELLVSLSDKKFNWGSFWGTSPGEKCHAAIVKAKFTLQKEAQSVPEPATVLLLGFGFVGVARFGKRKLNRS